MFAVLCYRKITIKTQKRNHKRSTHTHISDKWTAFEENKIKKNESDIHYIQCTLEETHIFGLFFKVN